MNAQTRHSAPWERVPETYLDARTLYRQICVRDPYFALENVIETGPGTVRARVPVELAPGLECSPISAAEAGRHLAILGSCAAAQLAHADQQHFHLAQAAQLTRLHASPRPRTEELLSATAKATLTGKRTARASAVISAQDGAPLFALEVSYAVLTVPLFSRMFADARLDMRRAPRSETPPPGAEGLIDFASLRRNPFAQPLPLGARRFEQGAWCAELTVKPELCKGHFALYPVLPVAMVMSGLSTLAAERLAQLLEVPSVRHLVVRGDVAAERMAKAGEHVRFSAEHVGSSADGYHFRCLAASTGGTIGKMDLVLAPVD